MSEILALALHSMHQDMSRLDQIAINMANVSTPGYKRQATAAVPFSDIVQESAATEGDSSTAHRLQARAGANGMAQLTDPHQGTLRSTSSSLDLAVDGDGFFEVATPNGPAYTRQGSFKLDGRGRLATLDGNPVMGKSGEIFLTDNSPVIDSQGNVTEKSALSGVNDQIKMTVGQLKIVKFDDAKALTPIGNGLYAGTGDTTQLNDTEVRIRQGFLENSNVSSLQEMMQLMQTMRHFESVQKTAQGYDEMISDAIKKLSDG